MKEQSDNQNKKITLKERLKDKRERAKIELIIYGIFFLGIIIFVRISSANTKVVEPNNTEIQSFVTSLENNYEYDIVLTVNEEKYHYYGKVLGNNSTINLKDKDKTKSYYLMNKKYYVQEENYILIDKEEVYPYIDSRYLNISTINEYLKLAEKENNMYKVKIKDLILDSESSEYITININEGDKNIVIDYTHLLKLSNNNITKVLVNITYSNINNIVSLEE